ncbi:hypothetical protein CTAM01_05415 [Colletotrichum tamarilloi]|uniref:Uncharacterized protein n=1 Tax=Colletotrichum tamarilloi TaxID=1209934 RepID=A0ABQ9RE28_9PEZI|nr:uncharacterized protein CTAM01_05415 [Colletotrichum tamarilloi]KAI3534294.1 hypothetical protein CSPX01_12215 [Colletotrichum filicis]KAK1501977.1 hypothetical protein CTAM01_05415 [Colletotrichum tamarilloi]
MRRQTMPAIRRRRPTAPQLVTPRRRSGPHQCIGMWRHLGILQRGPSVWLGIGRGPATTAQGIVAQHLKPQSRCLGWTLTLLRLRLRPLEPFSDLGALVAAFSVTWD